MLKIVAKTCGLMAGFSQIKMVQANTCTDLSHDGLDLCTYIRNDNTDIIESALDSVYKVTSSSEEILI